MITQQLIEQAYSYESYLQLVENVFAEGKTTGPNQSEELTHYTGLNIRRMNRLNKTTQIEDALKKVIQNIDRDQLWLVISEGWCGDAAQSLPVIHKMAELNDHIQLKIILRDENLEVMDAYLTNGSRSIPKLIILDAENLEEIAVWGSRPLAAQQLAADLKRQGMAYEEVNAAIQLWYAKDKTKSIQAEFVSLLTAELINS